MLGSSRRYGPVLYGLLLLLVTHAAHPAGIISTVAGGGPADNIPALEAPMGPTAVAVDRAGNVYVASPNLHRIFRIDGSGIITIVAGSGAPGYGGDDGPATDALLNYPLGLAVDQAGNLYIADTENQRIRRVDPAGIITTVAGNGIAGYGGDGAAATLASLDRPDGIAVDRSGNLYIADLQNQRVRKVDAGGVITTVAGNGDPGYRGDGGQAVAASLLFPEGVAVDDAGNVYIADTDNYCVRRVDGKGLITTFAGVCGIHHDSSGDGGPATLAHLDHPIGVSVDATGALYIADSANYKVRKVDAGGIITTVAGNGSYGFSGDGGDAVSAAIGLPYGVAVDTAANLYIADYSGSRIRKVNAAGGISTIAGNGTFSFSGDGGPAITANLSVPDALAFDAAGDMYIADSYNSRIRRVTPGGVITTVAGNGTSALASNGAQAVDVGLSNPSGISVDAAGNLYIADTGHARIWKVDTAGVLTAFAGNGSLGYSGDGVAAAAAAIDFPHGLAVDGAGNIYVADTGNGRIRRIDAGGVITTVAGNGGPGYNGDNRPALSASLSSPWDVAVDGAGNLYIADTFNQRVRKVDTAGNITTVAGNGTHYFQGDGGPAVNASLNYPRGVALDSAGNIYIADSGNNRIRKVDAAGTITTVAGTGAVSNGFSGGGDGAFSGDGGEATMAELNTPNAVAIGGSGGLYIADTLNHRIRRVAAGNRAPDAVAGPDLTVEATSAQGAQVTLDGSASSDPDGDPLTYTWTGPFGTASGASVLVNLPLGKSSVALRAADGRGGAASDSVSVTVQDATPPVITVPGDISLDADSPDGALVTYPPATATDTVDPAPTLSYSQASGTLFPPGTTTVEVTASDAAGNQSAAAFTVTVKQPRSSSASSAGQSAATTSSGGGALGLLFLAVGAACGAFRPKRRR